MSNEDDMEMITRKDLREELARLHAAFEMSLSQMATKQDLARMATKEDLARTASREDLAALRRETAQDTGRAINSAFEQFRFWFTTLDDRYRDLPNRMTSLEDEGLPTRMKHVEQKLFAPPPEPKRAARRATKKRRRAT
ncbi:MAG TPA: hypothetical protein VGM90_00600 [Kofleriaceae bacterium]|jgi:chromosome segregation ATPase